MVEIKVFVPTYFDKFKCIADKCPDTCCVGWEVDVDRETAEKYSAIGGELGNKIKKHLTLDEDGCNVFTLCDGDICPFLNGRGLCEIQLCEGEAALSRTCTLFPRFFDDFGKIREMGLGFGCPEAARIMLADNEPFSLEFYDEYVDEIEDVDEYFLEELINLRAEIFTILEKRELKFKTKIEAILNLAKKFQCSIDDGSCYDSVRHSDINDCLKILEEMEYIDEKRRNFVLEMKSKKLSENTINLYRSDFEKLMKYYIFRYLLKAVYDYDVLTKVKYGVFACIVISRIYSLLDFPDFEMRVRVMYGYSKEVEYSDVNMEILDEALFRNFGTEDLVSLL